jgi:uncharacterized membrane protein YidH (DUF202 family)
MLETVLLPLARGRGYAVDLAWETDMTDLLTRFLLAGLGLAMIAIGVLWLAARGVARWFAPRVIVVERNSEQPPNPSFPMTRALLLIVVLMLLLAFFGHPAPH